MFPEPQERNRYRVKILTSAYPWLARQCSFSFCSAVSYCSSRFGSLAYISCSVAISCRCSAASQRSYMLLVYGLMEVLGSTPVILYRSALIGCRLAVLCTVHLLLPRELM